MMFTHSYINEMPILQTIVTSIVSGTVGAIMGTSVRSLVSGDVGDRRNMWLAIMLGMMLLAVTLTAYLHKVERFTIDKESFTPYGD